jgi:hypothetical protein
MRDSNRTINEIKRSINVISKINFEATKMCYHANVIGFFCVVWRVREKKGFRLWKLQINLMGKSFQFKLVPPNHLPKARVKGVTRPLIIKFSHYSIKHFILVRNFIFISIQFKWKFNFGTPFTS